MEKLTKLLETPKFWRLAIWALSGPVVVFGGLLWLLSYSENVSQEEQTVFSVLLLISVLLLLAAIRGWVLSKRWRKENIYPHRRYN
jgi:ABC-type enterochelin transport system permease subunit